MKHGTKITNWVCSDYEIIPGRLASDLLDQCSGQYYCFPIKHIILPFLTDIKDLLLIFIIELQFKKSNMIIAKPQISLDDTGHFKT